MEKKTGIGKRLLSMLLAMAVTVTGQGMPVSAETGSGSTAGYQNPSYNAATDTATWSYIYLGSYPQTEVTGAELTSDIINAEYSGTKSSSDAWVKGIKYRRINEEATVNNGYFGQGKEYRYFRWEPIKWRVLENNDGVLTVMADKGMDCSSYGSIGTDGSLSSTAIRNWLSSTFYSAAFNSDDRRAIQEGYQASGASAKVALLSSAEMSKQAYGFLADSNRESKSRQMKISNYANARGGNMSSESGTTGNCWWWLETLGTDPNAMVCVTERGGIEKAGYAGDNVYGVAVPKMYVKLGNEGSLNPWYDGDSVRWRYVSFGNYPQMEISQEEEGNAELIQALQSASYDANGDTILGGKTYSRIQGTYSTSYFEWKPIKWRILQVRDNTLYMMADNALDCKSNNSENPVSSWLSDGFYKRAFSGEEKGIIKSGVTLLSHDYGFDDISGKRVSGSEYAYQKGCEKDSFYESTSWWLDTYLEYPVGIPEGVEVPEPTLYYPYIDGSGSSGRERENNTSMRGIVPCIEIDMNSNLWTLIEDESEETEQPLEFTGNSLSDIQKTTGESVTFSVSASGGHSSGHSYQWYYSTSPEGQGTKIEGESSSSYTISSTDMSMNGRYYYCIVTSGRSQIESARAKLTVVAKNGGGSNSGTGSGTGSGSGTKPGIGSGTGTGTGTGTGSGSGTKPGTGSGTGTNSGSSTKPSTGTTTKPAAKLPAPKLTVKITSSNAVKLTWKKVSGATGYYVYRTDSKKGKYKKIATTKKTSYKNSKLKSNKTYYYKVAAYKGKKTGTYSKVVSKKILGKPSTPKMKFTNKSSAQKFTISWNKLKHASHVEIWRKINKKGTYKKWKTVSAKKGKATYSYRSYTRGRTYFFQIRSYYVKDKVKVYSGYSKGLGIQL